MPMDAQGKPRMSRELLQRLAKPQQLTQPVGSQGSAQMRQSFAERKQVEQNRRIVHSYQESHLGTRSFRSSDVRQMGSELGRPRRRPSTDTSSAKGGVVNRIDSGQNRPSAGFKEPPARGYNPYA